MMQSECEWVRLGDYIEQTLETNANDKFGITDVMGMTITKSVISTKANIKNTDLRKFLVVNPNEFIYNPRTHGKKIGLGFNETLKPFLISWNNIAFKITKENMLNPIYLYMLFSRDEWDRQACFMSWGSSTEVFSWNSLCDIQIPLPSIEKQRDIVNVWKSLRNIKEDNEKIVEPLMALCRSYVQDLKHTVDYKRIGDFINEDNSINLLGANYPVVGINIEKQFMPTAANLSNVSLSKYKVLIKGTFVFSGMQTGRDKCIRIGLYSEDNNSLVSPAYTTFRINEDKGLLKEYMFMMFCRQEMDRFGWFISDSSVRANLDWNRFVDIQIPIPTIEVQRAIVNIYQCAQKARDIATQADKQLKVLCPALIQYAIHNPQ